MPGETRTTPTPRRSAVGIVIIALIPDPGINVTGPFPRKNLQRSDLFQTAGVIRRWRLILSSRNREHASLLRTTLNTADDLHGIASLHILAAVRVLNMLARNHNDIIRVEQLFLTTVIGLVILVEVMAFIRIIVKQKRHHQPP